MKVLTLAVSAIVAFACVRGSVFITDHITSRVIEFSRRKPHCQVHTDEEKITELLQKYPKRFSIITTEALAKMENPCDSRQSYGFIYPGTLWCGAGTKALDFSHLGVHSEEDKCCREHDNCPNSLNSGECRGDVCNTSSFTSSHCDCDRRFQQCLRDTGTETGNTIGAIFFNVAQISCFREKAGCAESERVVVKEDAMNAGGGRTACPIEFADVDKYVPSEPLFTLKHKKAFVLNMLLRKFRLLRK